LDVPQLILHTLKILVINLTTHVVDSSVYPGSGVLAL
jgi:hypothetical protein